MNQFDFAVVIAVLLVLALCANELKVDLMSVPLAVGAIVALLANYLVNRTLQE